MRSWGAAAAIALSALTASVLTASVGSSKASAATPAPPSAPAAPRCATCHAAETREWETSRHHDSYRDPAFQQSYANEPLAFCVRCHAPNAPNARRGAPESAGHDEGIGCNDCHTRTSAHARDPIAAAHPGTRPCSTCHSFDFADRRERMQRTEEEHAASAARATTCETCHMPAANGHARTHDFAAWRDPTALRDALAVDPVTRTPQGIDVTIRAVGVGHAFPTGDLFRALRVRVWTEDADGALLSDDAVWLERSFDQRAGAATREIADTRLGDMPRRLSFVTPEAPRRAHVVVSYERVMAVQQGIRTVFDSTILADVSTELAP